MERPSFEYVNKIFKRLSERIEELFTSVSNGKSLVASAITDKGVSTQEDATFSTMAENIRAIQTGGTGITPSGTKSITANGTHDVTSYASAEVNVPIPSGYIKPSGTKTVTENGTHDVTNYANVSVNVESESTTGKVFRFTVSEKPTVSKWVEVFSTDPDILAHKDDSTLAVMYHIVTPPSGASMLSSTVKSSVMSANNIYGCASRQTSAGAISPTTSAFTEGLRAHKATAGGIDVTDNGGIRLYSNTSYPLDVGEYIISVSW